MTSDSRLCETPVSACKGCVWEVLQVLNICTQVRVWLSTMFSACMAFGLRPYSLSSFEALVSSWSGLVLGYMHEAGTGDCLHITFDTAESFSLSALIAL